MRVAVLLLLATPCNARRNGGGNVDLGGLAGLFGALVSGVPWGRNMCGRRFRSIGVRGEPLARQGGRGMVHLLYPPTPVPARHPGLMHKARRTNSWLECSECTDWDKQFCTSSEPPHHIAGWRRRSDSDARPRATYVHRVDADDPPTPHCRVAAALGASRATNRSASSRRRRSLSTRISCSSRTAAARRECGWTSPTACTSAPPPSANRLRAPVCLLLDRNHRTSTGSAGSAA